MTQSDDIRHRLDEIGLQARDVDVVISTHFHFDHAGNHGDFPHARIIAQRECYEYAKANPNRCPPEIWDVPQLSYDLIEGDLEVAPGVRLVETSGHVPGHMSVVVRLPRAGSMVLAIDAIATRENLERDNWAAHVDPQRGRASARKLAAIVERERAVLITGHDAAEWRSSNTSPTTTSRARVQIGSGDGGATRKLSSRTLLGKERRAEAALGLSFGLRALALVMISGCTASVIA